MYITPQACPSSLSHLSLAACSVGQTVAPLTMPNSPWRWNSPSSWQTVVVLIRPCCHMDIKHRLSSESNRDPSGSLTKVAYCGCIHRCSYCGTSALPTECHCQASLPNGGAPFTCSAIRLPSQMRSGSTPFLPHHLIWHGKCAIMLLDLGFPLCSYAENGGIYQTNKTFVASS